MLELVVLRVVSNGRIIWKFCLIGASKGSILQMNSGNVCRFGCRVGFSLFLSVEVDATAHKRHNQECC